MKVLLIEDSPRLQRSLSSGLRRAGYAVDVAGDGLEGLERAESEPYAVVILDLMLPGLDGLGVLKRLREKGRHVRVLILTAKNTVGDRVEGLDLGADDYLTKPFALEELLARLRALWRRGAESNGTIVTVADLTIEFSSRKVTRAGHAIDLTRREYMLLEFLALRVGQTTSRAEIEAQIYEDSADPMSNVVESTVARLRRKIDTPGRSPLLHTRRGLGYLLDARAP